MGLDIGSLAANTATSTVEYMGQSCSVTYKPSCITAAALEQMDVPAKEGEPSNFLVFMADTITDWDVLLSPKKKVPLTPEGLKAVPLPLLRAVFNQMMTEAASGEAGKDSSDG